MTAHFLGNKQVYKHLSPLNDLHDLAIIENSEHRDLQYYCWM